MWCIDSGRTGEDRKAQPEKRKCQRLNKRGAPKKQTGGNEMSKNTKVNYNLEGGGSPTGGKIPANAQKKNNYPEGLDWTSEMQDAPKHGRHQQGKKKQGPGFGHRQ